MVVKLTEVYKERQIILHTKRFKLKEGKAASFSLDAVD